MRLDKQRPCPAVGQRQAQKLRVPLVKADPDPALVAHAERLSQATLHDRAHARHVRIDQLPPGRRGRGRRHRGRGQQVAPPAPQAQQRPVHAVRLERLADLPDIDRDRVPDVHLARRQKHDAPMR